MWYILVKFGVLAVRVGNFRQKKNSSEDEVDQTNGIPAVPPNRKLSEFRSEPFHGRENNSEFRSVKQK
jgi:hypothetical protein